MIVPKGFLNRMEFVTLSQTLDGQDLPAIGL
jgi:hypothetical protein